MHIAIEGLDGSGKTQTSKELARKLNFDFIEKPLHLITDEDDFTNYLKITKTVNANKDKKFRARFYGVGNYYVSRLCMEKNIVTDRHLASNYYWNYENDSEFFDTLVRDCGKPDYTFVLYVQEDERRKRIYLRNPEDPDLKRCVFSNEPYNKIEYFLKRYDMNYCIIDTTNMTLCEVVEYIVEIINKDSNIDFNNI